VRGHGLGVDFSGFQRQGRFPFNVVLFKQDFYSLEMQKALIFIGFLALRNLYRDATGNPWAGTMGMAVKNKNSTVAFVS